MLNTRALTVGLLFASIAIVAGARLSFAQGYICAHGGGGLGPRQGGTPILRWVIEKGKNGPVVVIGAVIEPEPDDPNDPPPAPPPAGEPVEPSRDITDHFKAAGATSVADLRVGKDNANAREVVEAIEAASIVFIRGGSQTRYVNHWKGTKTEAAIRALFARGGVVAGTSAGCAVLGEVIYDAQKGSLASKDILRDAHHPMLTLATGFLELTPGVLFDTHFTERARLPRMAVMMARAKVDLKREVTGIGVDAQTALCFGPDMQAVVIGQGAVTVLRASPDSRMEVPTGKPPCITNLQHTQMVAGWVYDLRTHAVVTRTDTASKVDTDGLRMAPLLQVARTRGGVLGDSAAGAVLIDAHDDSDALLNGALSIAKGEVRWDYAVVQTVTFESRGWLENRIGGVQWALADRPGWLGVYLTPGVDAVVDDLGRVRIEPAAPLDPPVDEPPKDGALPSAPKPSAAVFLETDQATWVDHSTALATTKAEGTRQSVAIEGAVLHILAPGWMYIPAQPGMGKDFAPSRVAPIPAQADR